MSKSNSCSQQFIYKIESWKINLKRLEKYLEDFYEHTDQIALDTNKQTTLNSKSGKFNNNFNRQKNYTHKLTEYKTINDYCTNKEIDPAYCAEYELFLDDFMEANAKFQRIDTKNCQQTSDTYNKQIQPIISVFEKYIDLFAYLDNLASKEKGYITIPKGLTIIYSELSKTFCEPETKIGDSCEKTTQLNTKYKTTLTDKIMRMLFPTYSPGPITGFIKGFA
jgi:hypothetical protein